MANKKQNTQGLTRAQLTKIWKKIGADGWLKLLNEHQVSRAAIVSPGTVKCICPCENHHDTDPSFWIHTRDNKQFARCFGSTCNFYTANPIELAAEILQTSEIEALNYLRDKFALTYLPRKVQDELIARKVNQEVKQSIYHAAHAYMCNALATPDDYPWAKKGVEWLTAVRHVSPDVLPSLPVGIVPPLEELNKILTKQYMRKYDMWKRIQADDDDPRDPGPEPPDRIEASIEYLSNTFKDEAYNGAILWPLHTGPNHISRLKLRTADSNSRSITMPDDKYEEDLGFYGLGWEHYTDILYSNNAASYVIVVEGEMDAMSVMAKFLETGDVTFPVVSAGGVGGAAHIEPILSSLGVDKVYLVGDSPEKGSSGDGVVQRWLEKITKLHCKVFVGWDELRPAGDFDDAINHPDLGIDKIREVVWQKTKENFMPPWKWAFEQARGELSTLDPDERRQMVECATAHGRYLKNRLECSAYVDVVTDAFPTIPAATLKLDIATHENTERGYIHRCRETLKEMFHVVGSRADNGTRSLVLYHKGNKHYHQVALDSPHAIAAELAPLVGSLVDFAQDKVGYPIDLLPSLEDEGRNIRTINDALKIYINDAVTGLAHGAVNINAAPQLRQGYHYATDPGSGEHVGEYIVCGRDVFSITRDHDATGYTELQGPVDNGFVFHGDFSGTPPNSWYPGGLSVDELNRGNDIDLRVLYDDIRLFLDTGFKFKNHAITSQFLAAVILTMPIMDCFSRPLILFVTGESNAGKSSLLSALGGDGIKELQLLYCAQGWSADYSASSVAQHGDNDSRLVVLDEFESSGKNGHVVASIFELYRGLVNGQATRTKSTQHGTGTIERHLKHPVVLGGISGAEKEQDLNRIVQIEMEKVPFLDGPAITIRKKMGTAKIKQMGQDIAVAMYRHVPALREYAKQISEEFADFQHKLPVKVEYRYASGLYSVFSVMQRIGIDWKSFFIEYVGKNERVFNTVNSSSESESLINAMLCNPRVVDPETKANATVLTLLGDAMQWDLINESASGIFYDPSTQLLLILAEQALARIVPDHHKRNINTAQRLKEILNRHPKALAHDEIDRTNVIQNLEKYTGRGLTWQQVVVISAKPWLRNTEVTTETETPTTPVTPAVPQAVNAGPQPITSMEGPNAEEESSGSNGVDW